MCLYEHVCVYLSLDLDGCVCMVRGECVGGRVHCWGKFEYPKCMLIFVNVKVHWCGNDYV